MRSLFINNNNKSLNIDKCLAEAEVCKRGSKTVLWWADAIPDSPLIRYRSQRPVIQSKCFRSIKVSLWAIPIRRHSILTFEFHYMFRSYTQKCSFDCKTIILSKPETGCEDRHFDAEYGRTRESGWSAAVPHQTVHRRRHYDITVPEVLNRLDASGNHLELNQDFFNVAASMWTRNT